MNLKRLEELWLSANISPAVGTSDLALLSFQSRHNLLLPEDLFQYFKLLNGSKDNYDSRFFKFYSLEEFESIAIKFKSWQGIPDYSNIINTLDDCKDYFIFSDYLFHSFSYAIRLYEDRSTGNYVIVVSGDQYKKIANSFNEFLDLYFEESIELQLNKNNQ